MIKLNRQLKQASVVFHVQLTFIWKIRCQWLASSYKIPTTQYIAQLDKPLLRSKQR